MADPTTITMISCPYCDKQWVREDTELACKDCTPALNTDLAIADLISAVSKLEDHGEPETMMKRRELLSHAHHKFAQIILKVALNE